MRVGVIALLHESNTFISSPTTIEHFRENLIATGVDVRDRMSDTHHEVSGFFEGLDAEDLQAVPIFAARAVPYGTITKETFDQLVAMMFSELVRAGDLDGILVAPHGATVSQEHLDADGFWLAKLREHVGPSMPIISTLDPHANLSKKMVDATNAIIAYRSNPHLDQRARGREAASLMARTLQGEVRPTQSAILPPMAINIECQQSTVPPCLPFYELADTMLERDEVLSNSILLGFPYADVAEMGSSVVVVTDNQPRLAEELAGELADYLWSHRSEFDRELISIDEALDQAMKLDGPICLLDMGDNVGGGSPADGTLLAHAIRSKGIANSFVCLCDPDSVDRAVNAGVGAKLKMQLGGKSDEFHGKPLVGQFTVGSLHDGKFEEPEPRHGGFTKCDQGRTAIVCSDDGLTIMLTTRRMPPFSLRQLTSCGLDPSTFRILVAKGVNAPVAAYAPVCGHLIRVNTPGVTTADMKSLDYQHRRRPMFPFEPDTQFRAH